MRLSPMFKDTKVTYSNSSLKLKGRKYATELIPVKSYEKFLVLKTVEDITNHLLKLDDYASVYSNASQYTGTIKACNKFASK